MTFWFRLPTDYDYTHAVRISPTNTISPVSFSRTLVNLNFWERYEFRNDIFPPRNQDLRAVSLTLGLKKTPRYGQCVFFRYDSGGERFDGQPNFEYFGGPPLPDANSLIASPYTGGDHNFLGFWCSSDHLEFQEPDSFNYANYRQIAHRSAEVVVPFVNQAECGPGSWHRISASWNLHTRSDTPNSSAQLYLDLHDRSNKKPSPLANEFRQAVAYAPDTYIPLNPTQDPHYPYPPDANPLEEGAMAGFMFPYNNSMILSLGETHAKRLGSYRFKLNRDPFGVNPGDPDLCRDGEIIRASNDGTIYPFWQLNSCIDNFRFYMGPSDPNQNPIPVDYFDPQTFSALQDTPYGALRYKVIHQKHGFITTEEPTWVFAPPVPAGSRLHTIGTRVYYPPDSNDNTPYVLLGATNNYPDEALEPFKTSLNEQNHFYDTDLIGSDFRITLQYKAFKPILDGDLSNIEEKPLVYFGEDHFTEIPWIKEVSIRYSPPQGFEVKNLTYN